MNNKNQREKQTKCMKNCVSNQKIREKLQMYSKEADTLTDEMLNIDSRRGQIQERLIQLVGAITALNNLINADK